MKRLFLAFSFSILAVSPIHAADEKDRIDPETQKSINRGLEWLSKKQNTDGSWGDSRYPHNTAVTGFCIIAYLSQGHVPDKGKYGPEVSRAVRFLTASARDSDGYLVGSRGGNMYCHGMATLALTQVWGMTGDEEVRKVLRRAVELIVRCQSDNGGWRYDPVPSGHDISVTIMQVMALRGAKDSGLHVPDRTMKKALEYINTCYHAPSGGYTYQPYNNAPGFARTAAGVCVIKLVGDYDKNVDRSLEFMKRFMDQSREHYWYGHYYAAHAMHQVGGKDWDTYYTMIRKKFAEMQSADGSWSIRNDPGSAGPVYQTAIAVISLSVPSDYLPIFQR
jgi:prenyltransferase beta subunit